MNNGDRAPQGNYDNYAQFIGLLDAATSNLTPRRGLLGGTLEILTLLFNQNNTGLQLWRSRLARASELLAGHSGTPESYSAVSELHDVALRMESMFRIRTQRVGERLAVVQARCAEIDRSLLELEKSKAKLMTARMLSQERENLRRAVSDLDGTPQGGVAAIPDPGLRDALKEAREAIILAEALMEAKGN